MAINFSNSFSNSFEGLLSSQLKGYEAKSVIKTVSDIFTSEEFKNLGKSVDSGLSGFFDNFDSEDMTLGQLAQKSEGLRIISQVTGMVLTLITDNQKLPQPK